MAEGAAAMDRVKRADLSAATLCRAIHVHRMQAWEVLCQQFPPKVVLAAIERDYRRGLLECGVSPCRPWLTEAGLQVVLNG